MSKIDSLVCRFAGLDVQYRLHGFDSRCCGSEMSKPWRARLVTNKNQNAAYRIAAYGDSREEAEFKLVELVEQLDWRPRISSIPQEWLDWADEVRRRVEEGGE